MEAKELYDFPGCSVDRYESSMAEGCANAKVLESVDPSEAGCWLGKCNIVAGEGAEGA
jgi:hypothetical protein